MINIPIVLYVILGAIYQIKYSNSLTFIISSNVPES